MQFQKISQNMTGTNFEGNSPPSVFISWHNYPNVSIAPLSPTQVLKDAEFLPCSALLSFWQAGRIYLTALNLP